MALNFDEELLTGDERRLLRQNNRNNLLHYLEGQARERKLENDLRIVGNDPGRMAPQTREAILNEAERLGIGRQAQERGRLMDHELKMLGLKNAGELAVAQEKARGMIGQGADAARLRADADLGIAQGNNLTALKQHEQEMASRLEQQKLEWGEDGGRQRIAEIEGRSRVEAAQAQAQATAELHAQQNALEEQKLLAQREKTAARIKLNYDKLSQRDKESVDRAATGLARENGISFEDARAQVMAAREQAQSQGGDVVTDSSGTKWKIVRDANGKAIGKSRIQ